MRKKQLKPPRTRVEKQAHAHARTGAVWIQESKKEKPALLGERKRPSRHHFKGWGIRRRKKKGDFVLLNPEGAEKKCLSPESARQTSLGGKKPFKVSWVGVKKGRESNPSPMLETFARPRRGGGLDPPSKRGGDRKRKVPPSAGVSEKTPPTQPRGRSPSLVDR